MDAFDGMLELEEVNDVEVYYEEIEGGGKVAKFRVQEADEDAVGVLCLCLRSVNLTLLQDVASEPEPEPESDTEQVEPDAEESGKEAQDEEPEAPFDGNGSVISNARS